MKPSRRILSRSIATFVTLAAAHASATSLVWDSNATTLPDPLDGGGVWTLTSPNFWDGTFDTMWVNANDDTAVFGTGTTMGNGVPGAITFTVAISAGGLDFEPYGGNATKYTIAGGTGGVLTLSGATPAIAVNTTAVRPFALINAVLAGTGGFDVTTTGNGILEIGTQTNTITGGTRLQSGSTLSVGGDLGLGASSNALTFAGNSTLLTRATFSEAVGHVVTIANGSTAKFDQLSGTTLTLGSGIVEVGGAGSMEKVGLGSLTMIRASAYTGETGVRQGTLLLNFGNVSAPTANLISSSSALRLYGGTLSITGKGGQVTSQTFSGLKLDPGASSLTMTSNTATSLTLNLGAITRNPGSALNVATIAAGTFYATSTAPVNGIAGGYGTVNATDWLGISGGNFTAFSAYQSSADPTTWSASDNVTLAGNPIANLGNTNANTLRLTAPAAVTINGGNTLTLGGGGVLVTSAGGLTMTGGTFKGGGGDLVIHQYSATAATIGSVIADNGGATALTKTGTGSLILTGANLYSGNTFLDVGLLDVNSDSALGTGSAVTSRVGTTLRFSGSAAITSTKNFQFDLGSDSYGVTANGAGGAGANFVVDVPNAAGVSISGAFNVTAGTLTKSGAGALTLTNGGSNQLGRGNGVLAVNVSGGAVIFNGGATSEWHVGQGDLTIGDQSANAATVTLASGTFNGGAYTSIGRGNGTTGLASGLTVSGSSTYNTGNLYTGFANSVAGYNTNPFVNLTGGSITNVADNVRLSESAGSTTTFTMANTARLNVGNTPLAIGYGGATTVNLNDSASVVVGIGGEAGLLNGDLQMGNTGRGLLKIGAGASVNTFQIQMGVGANGSGAIWNRGTLSVRAGAGTNNFALGNAAGAYGYYLHDTPVPTTVQEIGVGGAGGGNGVFEVRSGTLSSASWVTIDRTNSANSTSGMLLVSGGTLQPPNIPGRFYANQVNTAALTSIIDVGATGQIAGGAASDINLNNAPFAGHQTTFTVHDGGSVATPRIYAAQAAGLHAVVNLNGGTLVATAGGNLLDNNLDAVVIYPKGGTINTNGFDVTNGGNALTAPIGNGLPATLPIATAGAGYIGRPIVKITDTTGTGATAVANFDETTGFLTGITVTSPGSNYTAPTITLVGGGYTTPATLAPVVLAPNATTGGLTKIGNGTLTLSGAQTYAFLTTSAGMTNLNATLANANINDAGGTLNVRANANNSTVTVDGTTNFLASQTLAGLIIHNGGVATLGSPAASVAPASVFEDGCGALAPASVQPVPEPGGVALLAAGLAAAFGQRRRRAPAR